MATPDNPVKVSIIGLPALPTGTLYCTKGAVTSALVEQVNAVFAAQLHLRGHERPFSFKALGCQWAYVPGNLGIISLQGIEKAASDAAWSSYQTERGA